MSQQEEKINCPARFGVKTREDCRMCEYRRLDVCPVGTHFVRNGPEDKPVWERHLVKEDASGAAEAMTELNRSLQIYCPICQGDFFILKEVVFSGRMLASRRFYIICVKCGYSESLYKINEANLISTTEGLKK